MAAKKQTTTKAVKSNNNQNVSTTKAKSTTAKRKTSTATAKKSTTTKNSVSTGSSTTTKKQPTAAELKTFYSKNKDFIERFERAEAALQLLDPSKSQTRTFSTFSKEQLRTYMKNPLAQYKNLRSLSRYLYYVSQAYRRIISHNAGMIDLNYRNIVPSIDITQEVNLEDVKKSFYDTAIILDKMNLPLEFLKVYTTCWIEDVFFGCSYYDDTGMFILPLDPDYCQITSIYPTGDFGFDFDCSYFRNRQTELELWGEPFTTLYNEYLKDTTNNRWLPFPDENCVCLKINTNETTVPVPPYVTLFDSLINLEDLSGITAIADAQRIYKLLVATIPTLDNTNQVDDFAIDPNTAIDYFNRMLESLPSDYVDAIISPIPIEAITFDQDQASDVNKIENATKNILKTSGHTVMADPSGTTAMYANIQSDEDYAISALLPQTQAWLNRFLSLQLTNPAKVKFLEVTKYTKDKYQDELIKNMNYGSPLVTTLGILSGYSELEQMSMAYLNNALGLSNLFQPVATASTRSANEGTVGRPSAEDNGDALTDEASDSREKRETNG